MMDYDDSSIMVSTKELFYTDLEVKSEEYNFNVAFGVTYYDGSSEVIEDPEIGVMKAYYRSYGPGIQGIQMEEIPTRLCNLTDFGLDENGEYLSDEKLTE